MCAVLEGRVFINVERSTAGRQTKQKRRPSLTLQLNSFSPLEKPQSYRLFVSLFFSVVLSLLHARGATARKQLHNAPRDAILGRAARWSGAWAGEAHEPFRNLAMHDSEPVSGWCHP